MSQDLDILYLGTTYLDINTHHFPVEESLVLETETVGGEYVAELGGSSLNSARLAAALELKPLFIGKVGNDVFGQQVQLLMKQAGVESGLIVSPYHQTNLGINYSNSEGKTVMTVVGTANQSLQAEEIMAQISQHLPRVKYLYLSGYFKLAALRDAYPELIKQAHQAGVKVVVDHGRPNNRTSSSELENLRTILATVDLYLPSHDEFLTVWETESLELGLEKVKAVINGKVAVKLGSKGAIGFDETKDNVQADAFAVEIFHTVGAGDSFNTGFIKGLTLKYSFAQALRLGCATAALKISQPHLPNLAQVDELYQS
ncbi:MAG TPA: carbohydrate kinase family protein [Vitreimonas sp.]|nr:carbohydrate kinase family protein [Vitreimonas sp.]